MPAHVQAPQNTFVIRFWWELLRDQPLEPEETSAHARQRWHARIDHIQSGEGITARDARQLLEFIEHYVDLQHPDPERTSDES